MADETFSDLSISDIPKLKVPDLKKELKLRSLPTTGNKNELIERLQTALKSSEAAVDSIDDIEEELLNDDDDVHLDTNESVITELDHELDDSPKVPKRKLSETEPNNSKNAPKKVILNRNNSVNLNTETPKINSDDESKKQEKEEVEGKKVIKLSELSAKERLDMRAKKFGVTTLSADVKKAVRAERFGSLSNSSISTTNSNTSIDVLKKRAERFGGSVSTIMSNVEKKEKLEKRKERFGVANGTTQSEAVKAARLERFKQPVK